MYTPIKKNISNLKYDNAYLKQPNKFSTNDTNDGTPFHGLDDFASLRGVNDNGYELIWTDTWQ